MLSGSYKVIWSGNFTKYIHLNPRIEMNPSIYHLGLTKFLVVVTFC